MADNQNPHGFIDVIGLDLSLTSTGVACCGHTFSIPGKFDGPQRLNHIRHELFRVLDREHSTTRGGQSAVTATRPWIAVEGYSYGSSSRAHAIGELGGVIKVELYLRGWPYVEIPPKTRAKFATGNGNAGKAEVVSAISARTRMIWSGPGAEDECDAWILQEMGLTRFGQARFEWPAKNREALEKIDWTPWTEGPFGRVAIAGREIETYDN